MVRRVEDWPASGCLLARVPSWPLILLVLQQSHHPQRLHVHFSTVHNGNWWPQHPQQLHRATQTRCCCLLLPLRRLRRFRNAVARRQPSFTEYSSVSDAGAYTIAYSIPILDTNGSVAHVAASSILASSVEGAVRVPCSVCVCCMCGPCEGATVWLTQCLHTSVPFNPPPPRPQPRPWLRIPLLAKIVMYSLAVGF